MNHVGKLAGLFPIYVLIGGGLAVFFPDWFTWFRGNWIVWGLAVVMLGMGATLRIQDFKTVMRLPGAVALGLGAQYLIMPLLGWSIARGFDLPAGFAAGLILVACCPGGTASNIVAYLARAHVALSVTLTMLSTLAAVVLTPLLTSWLVGTLVPVDARGLLMSTVQVVILPLGLGLALHHFLPRATAAILPVAPLVSALVVALICASIIGQNAASLRESAPIFLLAVFLLHCGGFALGYALPKVLGFETIIRRTVSIEVGMQNSGLGVVLAQRHLADPMAALPCAVSSVFHSVIGSTLAGWWRLKTSGNPSPSPYSSSQSVTIL